MAHLDPPRDSFAQVSQAKFAWLVHNVGVALASLCPISSWVGLQIGYTNAVLDTLGISSTLDGFLVVLRSLPFRFFPLLYIFLILVILASGRDFGPMAESERATAERAEQGATAGQEAPGDGGDGGGIMPKPGTPLRSANAIIPFTTVVVVTFAGVILDGMGKIEEDGNQVRGSTRVQAGFGGYGHPCRV